MQHARRGEPRHQYLVFPLAMSSFIDTHLFIIELAFSSLRACRASNNEHCAQPPCVTTTPKPTMVTEKDQIWEHPTK